MCDVICKSQEVDGTVHRFPYTVPCEGRKKEVRSVSQYMSLGLLTPTHKQLIHVDVSSYILRYEIIIHTVKCYIYNILG